MGYGPRAPEVKYSPDQPRVPAGNTEGGRWTDEDGGGDDGLIDPRVLSDAAPDQLIPGAQYAQGDGLGGYPVDLREEERLGGHSIDEHVGKSENYLSARVREEASRIVERRHSFHGLGVGSFTSLESATKLINSTIAQNQAAVDQVAREERPFAFFSARFNSPTGYEAYLPTFHAEPYMRDTYAVGVFIVRDARAEKGWRIQTAYPLR